MKSVLAKKAVARRLEILPAASHPRLRRAAIGSRLLFLKGTVSRVRAAILLTRISKTRKMRSLRQQRLASALQLARAL